LSGMSWWYALKIHNVNIGYVEGVISHGLPIFSKYMPGKIWTILGRASRAAVNSENTISQLSFISLKEQLIYLLVGLIVSIVPVYLAYGVSLFLGFVLTSCLGLFLIVFNKTIHKFLLWLLYKILKKDLNIPLIKLRQGLKLSYYNLALWLSWTLAFYFFGSSFHESFSIQLAFVFPISVVYGVLAIIMPGGIGVREGIITAFLVASGLNIEVATTISVASRLWFLLGETFMFVLSLLLSRVVKKR